MMDEFTDGLDGAGDALLALAEGPGVQAAEALEAAFGAAGERIEAALGQAARSGELDFERMAESILRDLARVAAEALLTAGAAQRPASGGVNLNMNFAAGADERAALGQRGAIAAALARVVSQGGRFV